MKVIAITLKELTLILRDRAALLLLLVAPLALTLVMSFAFSSLNTASGMSSVSLVIVNQDEGDLGKMLVAVLTSPDLSDLLAPTEVTDAEAARALVDGDQAAAAVIIPPGFTEVILADSGDAARLEVYGNPGRPIGVGVVRSIVERFARQMATGVVGAQVSVRQLAESGRITEAQIPEVAPEIGQRVAIESGQRELILIAETATERLASGSFDFMAYYAPGMAILFLMFAMMSSARTLLAEREAGTLDRLRAAPLQAAELLGGKIMGVIFTGLLQMLVLILITHFFMGVAWGDPLAVGVHVVLVVTALAAMGLVIASISRTTAQANAIGTTVTMVLAAIGGNFVPRAIFPAWLKTVSYISPNAWGIEGFQALASGAKLADLGPEIAALSLMTVVFFALVLWGLRRFVK
jgi:ABC-2 type transport system permease protein